MLRPAKRLARAVLSSGPLYGAARARALRERPVTVLMYHLLGDDHEALDAWTVVRRSDFLRQVEFLRSHYEVVTLDQALAGQGGDKPLAVVTFDDGHATLHSMLLPLVEREALPVTVYVATGHVQSGEPYWFDRVMNALQSSAPFTLDLRAEGLGAWQVGTATGEANYSAISAVLQALKKLGPAEREAASRRIDALCAGVARRPVAALAPMTVPEVVELAASPWVTIGAHTHGHELLDQLPLAQAVDTIDVSRRLLQAWTGRPITHFAYPNGNYTPDVAREVERMGFTTAVTTRKGLWRPEATRFEIERVPIGRYDDLSKFKLSLLGAR